MLPCDVAVYRSPANRPLRRRRSVRTALAPAQCEPVLCQPARDGRSAGGSDLRFSPHLRSRRQSVTSGAKPARKDFSAPHIMPMDLSALEAVPRLSCETGHVLITE